MADRIEVGRVIFREDSWLVQTLANHVGNVTQLTTLWDNRRAFQGSIPDLGRTRSLVKQAAEIHDMAKPAKFQLRYEQDKFNKKWRWSYSFAGHRFEAFHANPYVQALAQLHHEYSVAGITKNIARLKLDPATADIAENLPLDLYALEMCDQIEATLTCAVLEDIDPEARVFMDFQFNPKPVAEHTYQLEPFLFAEAPVHLKIEYVQLEAPFNLRETVEDAGDEDSRRIALREIQNWLLNQLHTETPPFIQYKEVTLCPWT
jgi:hypothetical protein